MADLKELRNKRGKAIADARAILDKADEEKRAMTEEESTQYDQYIADAENIKKDIDREERQQELEREAAELDYQQNNKKKEGVDNRKVTPLGTDEYRSAYSRFIAIGQGNMNPDEIRALSAGTSTEGGYLLMPEQMVDSLLKDLDNSVFIRGLATKFRVPSAESLGVPTLDTDVDDADWTTELQTGSADSSMAFGKRNLHPTPFAKRIKISRDLLKRMPGVENFVRARLAYKFGITEEKAFMTGAGNSKPLGLFTASNDGIATGRDVSTGNTTTAVTFDGLINAKYTLKGPYWSKAKWIFHRDALKMISKIKNGQGDYVWRESVREGEPDRLLDIPFHMSEYAPNTFTTGLYAGILGDFSYYWIADAIDMELQRLEELYAESNQVGIIGRKKADGMPVLQEAFVRVTLA